MKKMNCSSADLLQQISTQLSITKEANRFYALQWLWDFVSANSKNGMVSLTKDQFSILQSQDLQASGFY